MAEIAEPENSLVSQDAVSDLQSITENDFTENLSDDEDDEFILHNTLAKKKITPPAFTNRKRSKKFSLPLALAAPRATDKTVVRQDAKRKRMTVSECFRKTVIFLLSSVGITVMVVAYSIIGGLVFRALESPNEQVVQNRVSAVRQKYVNDLYVVFDKMNMFRRENWTAGADLVLRHFQKDIFDFVTKEGWSGEEVVGGFPKWNFASSLLYSVTVITTIGYGTVTPKTFAGQAITMLYALFGIPLMFVCLSNIGRYMAASFRTLYGRAWCVTCRRKWRMVLGRTHTRFDKIQLNENGDCLKQNNAVDVVTDDNCGTHHDVEIPITACLLLVIWYIVFGAILFTIWETDWDIFTGAYFCFITLSTIGFGDIVPGMTNEDWADEVKQVVCTLYLLIGLTTLAMCFELIQERGQNIVKRFATALGLLREEQEEAV